MAPTRSAKRSTLWWSPLPQVDVGGQQQLIAALAGAHTARDGERREDLRTDRSGRCRL